MRDKLLVAEISERDIKHIHDQAIILVRNSCIEHLGKSRNVVGVYIRAELLMFLLSYLISHVLCYTSHFKPAFLGIKWIQGVVHWATYLGICACPKFKLPFFHIVFQIMVSPRGLIEVPFLHGNNENCYGTYFNSDISHF